MSPSNDLTTNDGLRTGLAATFAKPGGGTGYDAVRPCYHIPPASIFG